MSRIPLRLRLTAVFALTLAAVLAAAGTYVYVSLGDSLLEQVDDGVSARAGALTATVSRGDVPQTLPGDDEEFAQVVSADDEVVAATPGFDRPLLAPAQREAAARDGALVETTYASPEDEETERARVVVRQAGKLDVVVGGSLDDRGDALETLLTQLLVGGPAALALACGAAYVLAGRALGPVEAMRRRAAEISAQTSGERLPLPDAADEIRRLGETLNAMLDRLEDGLRRERNFVADASHELRTPLALLQAELELALRRPRTHEELGVALRSAAEEVDRLVRLAEDLLVLASSEDGRLPLRRESIATRDLLDDVARRFDTRAGDAGRTIAVDSVEVGEVVGDRLRLEQLLGNLVDNALRHGGGAVTLGAVRDDGHVVLSVADEGAGFPAPLLARAFERFSRGDAARTGGGPGLGLAIVDAIARAHGGEARARNGPGGGAEVTIVIPRV